MNGVLLNWIITEISYSEFEAICTSLFLLKNKHSSAMLAFVCGFLAAHLPHLVSIITQTKTMEMGQLQAFLQLFM